MSTKKELDKKAEKLLVEYLDKNFVKSDSVANEFDYSYEKDVEHGCLICVRRPQNGGYVISMYTSDDYYIYYEIIQSPQEVLKILQNFKTPIKSKVKVSAEFEIITFSNATDQELLERAVEEFEARDYEETYSIERGQ